MELNDMKAAWTALDNRLKKNEEFKETIILEMIQTKAGKSMSKLINLDLFGAIVLILIIPFGAFFFDQFRGKFWAWDILVIFSLIVSFLGFIWQVYKIYGLMKVDFSKKIGDNIYYMNRYNIQIKRETIFQYLILIPIFVILAVLTYATMKAPFYLWIFLVCMFVVATLFSYWSYKRIYGKNIESIIKSLSEIKELKEE